MRKVSIGGEWLSGLCVDEQRLIAFKVRPFAQL